MVLFGASLRSPDEDAAGFTQHEAACLEQKLTVCFLFKLHPQFVCALHQGHVQRMLEIGFADDSCRTVRRTELVRGFESVQTQDAPPPFGNVPGGGTAHCPQTSDDDVVIVGQD